MDVPIIADIDETSKVLSLEFLEYIGEVRVSVVDANGNIVYGEIVDTQDASSSIISLDDVLLDLTDFTYQIQKTMQKVFLIYNIVLL